MCLVEIRNMAEEAQAEAVKNSLDPDRGYFGNASTWNMHKDENTNSIHISNCRIGCFRIRISKEN